jgi:hypothetical protein
MLRRSGAPWLRSRSLCWSVDIEPSHQGFIWLQCCFLDSIAVLTVEVLINCICSLNFLHRNLILLCCIKAVCAYFVRDICPHPCPSPYDDSMAALQCRWDCPTFAICSAVVLWSTPQQTTIHAVLSGAPNHNPCMPGLLVACMHATHLRPQRIFRRLGVDGLTVDGERGWGGAVWSWQRISPIYTRTAMQTDAYFLVTKLPLRGFCRDRIRDGMKHRFLSSTVTKLFFNML